MQLNSFFFGILYLSNDCVFSVYLNGMFTRSWFLIEDCITKLYIAFLKKKKKKSYILLSTFYNKKIKK